MQYSKSALSFLPTFSLILIAAKAFGFSNMTWMHCMLPWIIWISVSVALGIIIKGMESLLEYLEGNENSGD